MPPDPNPIIEQRKSFGRWLREMRTLSGYEQQQAADRADVSRVHWSRVENGDTGIKRDTLTRMAQAVHADPAEAFRRAGFQPPQQLESSGQGKRTSHVIAAYRGQLTPQVDEQLARIVEAFITSLPPSTQPHHEGEGDSR